MAVTAPKNLKITRISGNKFKISWKLGQSNYGAQELVWYEYYKGNYTKDKKTSYITHKVNNVSNKTTEVEITVPFSNYPITGYKRLYYIRAEVRGKKGKTYSAWTKFTFTFKPPNKPNSLTVPGGLGDTANIATYSWSINDTKEQVFTTYQYQFAEVTNYSATNLNAIGWDTNKVTNYTATTATSITRAISAMPSGTDTVTQFFRIRAFGPMGFSEWVTSYHVFGAPKKAVVNYTKAQPTASGYLVTVDWTSDGNTYGSPIDSTTVQYSVGSPVVTRTVDSTNNRVNFSLAAPGTGLSWSERGTFKDTVGNDRLTFDSDVKPSNDECFYARVNNLHDTDATTTYGTVQIVKSSDLYGKLSTPTLTSASYVAETKLVTVTVPSNSLAIANSYIAIYVKADGFDPQVIGIMPYGTSSGTYMVPEDVAASTNITFGIQALIAGYSPSSASQTAATIFTIDSPSLMESGLQWDGGSISVPPTLSLSDTGDGSILVEWNWSWADAESAELSWSTNKYAWESTDEPSVYIVNNNRAGRWRITGLDYNTTYYVRIRLIQSGDEYETYGLYSDIQSITLTADTPTTPILVLDPTVVMPGGEVRCSWGYVAEDGSNQIQADIVEVKVINNSTQYVPLTQTNTAQSAMLYLKDMSTPWAAGEVHNLAVRTFSNYGTISSYSNPVALRVADELEVSITLGTGFSTRTETLDGESVSYNVLTGFPFTVTIGGAGDNGTTSMYITRMYGHVIERPDESKQYGYENETVVLIEDDADGQITVNSDSGNIYGSLDDTEWYALTAVATDEYGQMSSQTVEFMVDWDHKANIPSADIEMDYDYNVAVITPRPYESVDLYLENGHVIVEAENVEPEVIGDMSFTFNNGRLIYNYDSESFLDFDIENTHLIASTDSSFVAAGDVCDIYRLSSGKPELVYSGAEFGISYVDLYPAIGRFGGYRVVYRTKYNDYITNDNIIAWTDYGYDDGASLDIFDAIIDFDDEQVSVPFNVSLSHTWKKDFIETKYLGGAVQGDWNEGVSHTLKLSTVVAVEYFSDTYRALRRLADYAGVCHVRTPDGSSFPADVQVSESQDERKINMLASFTLDITEVDQEAAAGMLYSDWNAAG